MSHAVERHGPNSATSCGTPSSKTLKWRAPAVFVAARRRLLPPKRLLDLGLVLQFVAAFDIAATRAWTGALTPIAWYGLLPTECVLMVAYPLVMSNNPGKVLLAPLLAAFMGRATVVVSAARGGPSSIVQPCSRRTFS